MKTIKTTFTALLITAALITSTISVGAEELKSTNEPITTQSVADPGTGGGGGR
jgi:hypothetical protein